VCGHNARVRNGHVMAAVRMLLNKADLWSQRWGGGKRDRRTMRQLQSASMYSLLSRPLSVHVTRPPTHSAHSVPRSWPTRHLPVTEFTACLYRLWAKDGGWGEVYPCRPQIIVPFGPATCYGMPMWIITLPPVSFPTPPAGRPPMPPTDMPVAA